MASPAPPLVDAFFSALADAPLARRNDPDYYTNAPAQLLTDARLHSFTTGTGASLYSSLAPLLESTVHELVLVTCFWAPSPSLDTLNATLRALSAKAVRRGTTKIRVRICFSSSSFWQKLFHAQTPQGQEWSPASWKKLHLPDPSELGGLDLRVKSVFMLPFSVMHPKFIVVDRRLVVLPSCNVSWEEWFEGAILMSGGIVDSVLSFYWHFWERRESASPLPDTPDPTTSIPTLASPTVPSPSHTSTILDITTPALFLPSPHHLNPCFRLFSQPQPPLTPLNTFLLTALSTAKHTIRIQTPNLTSPPVLSAVLAALARGVTVTILTSARLMRLEQLVTAGTTTGRCIRWLVRRHAALARPVKKIPDEETALALVKPGTLDVAFWEPTVSGKAKDTEPGEPLQSHVKVMVVDDECVVLGSGNLDRASWWTSQELGVVLFGAEAVGKVVAGLDQGVKGRARGFYGGKVGGV